MKIIDFNTNGNDKQKECARAWGNNEIEEILYGGAKGGAKSFTGCSLIFGDALIYPKTQYFIARKKLNDLRRFTIPSIHEVLEGWSITSEMFKYNGQDSYFELYNQSKVFLIDAKYLPSDPKYHRFGSMQMTRGWIEEGGEFEYDSYSNLKISIGRWKNDIYNLHKKLLITANPSKNFLYRLFYLAHKNGTLEEWRRFIQALPYDNKMLPDGYIENLERTLKGAERKRLLTGEWEYDDDPNALCDYDKVIEIFENDHLPTGKKYLTADVARFGSDKAIIGIWNEWNLTEVHVLEVSKTTEIQELINHLRRKHHIPKSQCVADDDGVGGGVVDNTGIKGFVNNSKPVKENGDVPNYSNLQTQCLYKLADKINENEINVSATISQNSKDEIVQELEQLKSDNKQGQKLKIMSKDEVKSIIGRSPDWRDMIMMRVFFDLKEVKRFRARAS